MKPLPFYNTSAWRRVARKQALLDAGCSCQRCGTSLVVATATCTTASHTARPQRLRPNH